MALPEIVKDIEARIIRPASTDNAIVRFDGTTGQVQNTNNIIDIFPVTEKNRYRINELGEKRKRVKNKLYLKTKNCKELQNS